MNSNTTPATRHSPDFEANGAGPENEARRLAFIRDLSHSVWEIRRNACEQLSSFPHPQTTIQLVHALDDGVGAVRFAAAEALGKLMDRSAIRHLLVALNNPRFGSYAVVIESLVILRAPDAIPHFIRLLRDRNPRVRNSASNALMTLTRQFIEFDANGTEESRNAAAGKWEKWWAAKGRASDER